MAPSSSSSARRSRNPAEDHQAAQPERHRGEMHHVERDRHRRQRRSDRVPRHRPGGEPGHPEAGQQDQVGPGRPALAQRSQQHRDRGQDAQPHDVGGAVAAAEHVAQRGGVEVQQAAPGDVRRLNPQRGEGPQGDQSHPDPQQPVERCAVQPLRPQRRQRDRSADQQHQARVPEVLADTDRGLGGGVTRRVPLHDGRDLRRRTHREGDGAGDRMAVGRDDAVADQIGAAGGDRLQLNRQVGAGDHRVATLHPLPFRADHQHPIGHRTHGLGEGQHDPGGRLR